MPGRRDLMSAVSHIVFIASVDAYLRFLVGITPIHLENFKGDAAQEKSQHRARLTAARQQKNSIMRAIQPCR